MEEGHLTMYICSPTDHRLAKWQHASSGQSHAGQYTLLGHHPARVNNLVASYVISIGWVRWLVCCSYITSLLQSPSQHGLWQTRIFFYLSFIFFGSCYQVAQNNWNNRVVTATFLQLLLSLSNLTLLLVAFSRCSNGLCSFFPFLSFSSNSYTQRLPPHPT